MNAPIAVAEPLSVKDLLDRPLRLARTHLRRLYLPFALPLALVAGLHPLVQYWLTPATLGRLENRLLAQMMVLYGLTLVVLTLYGLAFIVMVVAASDILSGGTGAPSRAWQRALDPRLLLTTVLAWVAFIAGLIFCILPGIYVWLILSATVPVMATERRFGLAALRRSIDLMSHNPRRRVSLDPRARAFLLRVVSSLLGYALTLVVQLPFTIALIIIMLGSTFTGRLDPQVTEKLVWLQVPMNMLGMLAQTLAFLYMAFGIALLYFDVRRRKEGDDLTSAADSLLGRAGSAP